MPGSPFAEVRLQFMRTLAGLLMGSLAMFAVLIGPGARADPDPRTSPLSVTAPPAGLQLDPFYRKAVLVGRFPIVGSDRVRDAALLEAAYIVGQMLARRPDVIEALADSGTRLAVMSCDELTTAIPEHSDLTPRDYWDRRARGLGATRKRPAVSCGEENLLQFPGDPYAAENILVHEFAHAIHEMALKHLDPAFETRLSEAFAQAESTGLWKGTYAASNLSEYWAEGVQSYFGTNRQNDAEHNHVNTREELRAYDSRLFALIDSVFDGCQWSYIKPLDRSPSGRAHLNGYDFSASPEFRWPEHLRDAVPRRE